jgi:hypothetical protein
VNVVVAGFLVQVVLLTMLITKCYVLVLCMLLGWFAVRMLGLCTKLSIVLWVFVLVIDLLLVFGFCSFCVSRVAVGFDFVLEHGFNNKFQ